MVVLSNQSQISYFMRSSKPLLTWWGKHPSLLRMALAEGLGSISSVQHSLCQIWMVCLKHCQKHWTLMEKVLHKSRGTALGALSRSFSCSTFNNFCSPPHFCVAGKDQRILSGHHIPPLLLYFTPLWSFSSPSLTGVWSLLHRKELPPLQCPRLPCCHLAFWTCARANIEWDPYPDENREGLLGPQLDGRENINVSLQRWISSWIHMCF